MNNFKLSKLLLNNENVYEKIRFLKITKKLSNVMKAA